MQLQSQNIPENIPRDDDVTKDCDLPSPGRPKREPSLLIIHLCPAQTKHNLAVTNSNLTLLKPLDFDPIVMIPHEQLCTITM